MPHALEIFLLFVAISAHTFTAVVNGIDADQAVDGAPPLLRLHAGKSRQLFLPGKDRGQKRTMVQFEQIFYILVYAALLHRLRRRRGRDIHRRFGHRVFAFDPAHNAVLPVAVDELEFNAGCTGLAAELGPDLQLVCTGGTGSIQRPAHRLEQRGLAGAVLADDADDILGKFKLQRLKAAVILHFYSFEDHMSRYL
ncbi:MAG: hypothetical protein BWY83_00773 [bacterium ADurb.Bin478]|nr:MAG: hypothetical protein BWY83_00773 [bacterium ADurb.Bin478]